MVLVSWSGNTMGQVSSCDRRTTCFSSTSIVRVARCLKSRGRCWSTKTLQIQCLQIYQYSATCNKCLKELNSVLSDDDFTSLKQSCLVCWLSLQRAVDSDGQWHDVKMTNYSVQWFAHMSSYEKRSCSIWLTLKSPISRRRSWHHPQHRTSPEFSHVSWSSSSCSSPWVWQRSTGCCPWVFRQWMHNFWWDP